MHATAHPVQGHPWLDMWKKILVVPCPMGWTSLLAWVPWTGAVSVGLVAGIGEQSAMVNWLRGN